MKLLDLCCGMGGWSIGFARANFDCTGIDIVDVGYPYRLIVKDIRVFSTQERYDVVVASPPCREFTQLTVFLKPPRIPQDPQKGIELVQACLRVIQEVHPRFWVLENVRGARKYIEPILGKPRVEHPPWYLWGAFPEFLLPQSNLPKKCDKGASGRINANNAFDPLRTWKRSRIPLPLSVALASACSHALQEAATR